MTILGRTLLCVLLLCLPPAAMSSAEGERDVEREHKELQDARLKALQRLFRQQPAAQQVLENGLGYAVFSSVGLDLGLVSNRRGGGILRINRSGRDVFYKMLSTNGSQETGLEGFAVIVVFQSPDAIARVEEDGWAFPGETGVNPQPVDQGDGSLTESNAAPGTAIYPLTATGARLQQVLQGSRFLQDEGLN